MFILLNDKNYVRAGSVLSVHPVGSVQMKRFIDTAKLDHRYIDATRDKATKSVVVTDKGMCYGTSMLPETILKRVKEALATEKEAVKGNDSRDSGPKKTRDRKGWNSYNR